MAIQGFPPIESADEHGLLALGGDLELSSLLLAYTSGIFPWPISEEYPLAWFSPDPRGILAFDKLHISKSLKKFLKKNPYEVRFNTNFEAVIYNCAKVKRADNQGTWITQEIINSYIELHKNGFAYSIETYLNNELVGGVYGVCINRFYSGESMFHTADNASKVALIALLYQLKQRDIGWIDTQMVTPVVEALGGVEIPRDTYIKMLKISIDPTK
jgi:leucyl/phenylalanyl-tRNA--protein transferase